MEDETDNSFLIIHRNSVAVQEEEQLEKETNNNKELISANPITSFTLTDAWKVIKAGQDGSYTFEKLFKSPTKFTFRHAIEELIPVLKKKDRLTLTSLISLSWNHNFWLLMTSFLPSLAFICTPFLLQSLINWMQSNSASDWQGLQLILLITASIVVVSVLNSRALLYCYYIIADIRNVMGSAIVHKIELMQRQKKINSIDVGKVSILLNSDVDKIGFCLSMVMVTVGKMASLGIVIIILYKIIGPWILLLPLLVLVSMGIQEVFSGQYKKMDESRRELIDKRARLIGKMLKRVKNIKHRGLEIQFYEQINNLKSEERELLTSMGRTSGQIYSVVACPTLIFFLIFMTFNTQKLDIGLLYCLIAILQSVKSAFESFATLAVIIKSSSISLARLNSFLLGSPTGGKIDPNLEKKIKRKTQDTHGELEDNEDDYESSDMDGLRWTVGRLEIKHASFSWFQKEVTDEENVPNNSPFNEPASEEAFLKEINLRFDKGKFYGVIGNVGSGKTALLKAIQRQMNKTQGKIKVSGSTSMIMQESFMINDTVRNNILFGNAFERRKYRKIIKMCKLKEDFNSLPGGDMTEIGENGTNLSGGQKQRICIARALYADPDIYLIDDCLNALDNKIGGSIFRTVFSRFLGTRTRIMVTNNVSLLQNFDEILMMDKGQVLFKGSYNNLCLLYPHLASQLEEMDESESLASLLITPKTGLVLAQEEENRRKGKLTQKETKKSGIFDSEVFGFYLKNGGLLAWCIILTIFGVSAATTISLDWWFGRWTDSKINGYGDFEADEYSSYTLCIIIFIMLINVVKIWSLRAFMTSSSYNICMKMVWSVLRRPMSFFHVTKAGVVVNRCTDDVEIVDYEMQLEFHILIEYTIVILASWVLAVFSFPLFVILLILNLSIIFFVLRVYLKTSVDLKRLYRISRSRVLSAVLEYINILKLYGSSKISHRLHKKWKRFHNESMSISVHEARTRGWIEMTLSIAIGSVFIFLCFLIYIQKVIAGKAVESAVAIKWGLILSYAFLNLEKVASMVYNSGLFINNMSIVERLKEFVDSKKLEASLTEPSHPGFNVPYSWPENGAIEFKNVTIRYREGTPDVIKGINFSIKSGEKVGIIGRTGSGKSTLFLSLMRLLEIPVDVEDNQPGQKPLENKNGQILVAGVDIAHLPLHLLRKSIAIIAQEPVLMGKTIRESIDPFNHFSEKEILDCFSKFGSLFSEMNDQLSGSSNRNSMGTSNRKNKDSLSSRSKESKSKELKTTERLRKEVCSEMGNPSLFLDFELEEGATNLSLGIRQLICIVRVLLLKPKILLLDEATASLDKQSEGFVQQVIERDFAGVTILAIAHRLDTVANFDRLLVLKDGKIEKEGPPKEILRHGVGQSGLH